MHGQDENLLTYIVALWVLPIGVGIIPKTEQEARLSHLLKFLKANFGFLSDQYLVDLFNGAIAGGNSLDGLCRKIVKQFSHEDRLSIVVAYWNIMRSYNGCSEKDVELIKTVCSWLGVDKPS